MVDMDHTCSAFALSSISLTPRSQASWELMRRLIFVSLELNVELAELPLMYFLGVGVEIGVPGADDAEIDVESEPVRQKLDVLFTGVELSLSIPRSIGGRRCAALCREKSASLESCWLPCIWAE